MVAVSVDLDLVCAWASAVESVLTAGLLDVPSVFHSVSLSFLATVYQNSGKAQHLFSFILHVPQKCSTESC